MRLKLGTKLPFKAWTDRDHAYVVQGSCFIRGPLLLYRACRQPSGLRGSDDCQIK